MIDVRVGFDDIDRAGLDVDIGYEIRGLNDPRNLVFPFYVIPEEPGRQEIAGAPAALPVGNGG